MKKLILLTLVMFGFCEFATAKPLTYLDEVRMLGTVSGQGLACRARKYQQYELLARAVLITKAKNDALQEQAMRVYNEAKIDEFGEIYLNQYADCDKIVHNFNRQKIFKSVLYADGRIKLYDGTLLKPRKLYNASSVYKSDPQVYQKAIDTYKKALATAKKNSKNAKKIPLRDANYSKYANQF